MSRATAITRTDLRKRLRDAAEHQESGDILGAAEIISSIPRRESEFTLSSYTVASPPSLKGRRVVDPCVDGSVIIAHPVDASGWMFSPAWEVLCDMQQHLNTQGYCVVRNVLDHTSVGHYMRLMHAALVDARDGTAPCYHAHAQSSGVCHTCNAGWSISDYQKVAESARGGSLRAVVDINKDPNVRAIFAAYHADPDLDDSQWPLVPARLPPCYPADPTPRASAEPRGQTYPDDHDEVLGELVLAQGNAGNGDAFICYPGSHQDFYRLSEIDVASLYRRVVVRAPPGSLIMYRPDLVVERTYQTRRVHVNLHMVPANLIDARAWNSQSDLILSAGTAARYSLTDGPVAKMDTRTDIGIRFSAAHTPRGEFHHLLLPSPEDCGIGVEDDGTSGGEDENLAPRNSPNSDVFE